MYVMEQALNGTDRYLNNILLIFFLLSSFLVPSLANCIITSNYPFPTSNLITSISYPVHPTSYPVHPVSYPVHPVRAIAWDLSSLSLQQKVGQLLMVHFNGEVFNDAARTLIEELHVGAIIYYRWANSLKDPAQIQQLSLSLQDAARARGLPPLLIAVDQENGVVTRLVDGFVVFPGNYAVGKTDTPYLAYKSAYYTAEQLKAVGINMNLAPVVDVNINSKNPIIGIRSFGTSPAKVATFGYQSLLGYRQQDIIATLKHFPGHGDVTVDSHEALPTLHKDRQELERIELYPFQQLLPYADVIMTAHLSVPAIDDTPYSPATLSKKIVTDLLRVSMGYQGVIITDSLVMQGLLDCCGSIEEAAIKALLAGHDILCLGGKQLLGDNKGLELTIQDIKKIRDAIVNAVKEGRISEKQIDASLERILTLKESLKLDLTLNSHTIEEHVDTEAQRSVAMEIAANSVAIEHQKITLPLSKKEKRVAFIAPEIVRDTLLSVLSSDGEKDQMVFFSALNPNESQLQDLIGKVDDVNIVVLYTYNAWKFPGQQKILDKLTSRKIPTIVVTLRDPQDAILMEKAIAVVNTYSPTTYSIKAAHNLLFK